MSVRAVFAQGLSVVNRASAVGFRRFRVSQAGGG